MRGFPIAGSLESLKRVQGQAPYTPGDARPGASTMKIGELATATATSVEAIRFYEREGLLPPPTRTQGNFRIYGAAQQERLLFIRYCRNLDMSLDEVRALLALKDAPAKDCGDVHELVHAHLEHVTQ